MRRKSVPFKLIEIFLITVLTGALVSCASVSFGGGSSGGGAKLSQISVAPSGAGLPVGATDQFVATGTYSNGNQKNISSSVTWSSSPAGLVTIDSKGKATAVATGQVTITATSGSISGSAPLTVNSATLVSVTVNPIGPAVETAKTQQFTATANYSDNSHFDITSDSKTLWTATAPSVASISSSGLATGLIAGQTTISASYNNSFSSSTALNVVAPPASTMALNGDYAFSITAADSAGPSYYAGSFHANSPDASGNGTIASGIEDANTSAGVQQGVALAGSYIIYPDGRGTIAFNSNSIHPSGIALRFILASNRATGLVIQFDGHGSAAGSFELQGSSAFNNASFTGNYVFQFNGIDSSSNPMGEIGLFTSDGAGNITAGSEDKSDFGVTSFNPALTGSYSISSNGRGTLALSNPSGSSNFIVYVISANKINLIEVDPSPSSVLSGVAEKQASQAFSNSTLAGPGYAFLLNRAPSASRGVFDVIGRAKFDGSGNISAGTEEEVGSGVQNTITGGTYNVGGDGRGVMQATTNSGIRLYIFYVVNPSRLYMLDEFSPWAGTGAADLQFLTLNNSILSGTYALSGASIGQNDTEVSIWMTADGAGNFHGIADLVANGVPSSVIVNASYSVTPNGRTFVQLLPPPVGAQSFILYLVSGNEAKMLGSQPALDGNLLLQ
jgi:hypothetical protein